MSNVNLDTQVLLVAGGYGSNFIATTEILRTINGRWTKAGNLPKALQRLKGATLDNTVFLTGKCRSLYTMNVQHVQCELLLLCALTIPGGDDSDDAYSAILRYDPSNDVWTTAGQMREKRKHHAVAVVDRDTVEDRCY